MPPGDRPWTTPARRLVLHNAGGDWRYAIYSDVGVVDGALRGLSATAAPEQAQAALLAHATDLTGHRYAATWSPRQPHGWSATLAPAEP